MFVPVIVPAMPSIENAVMSFAGFSATVTVTIYDCVELSAAVTVYVTGLVKSCATPIAGLILAPVYVIEGVNEVTELP